jgi:hypothetical protein
MAHESAMPACPQSSHVRFAALDPQRRATLEPLARADAWQRL